MPDIDLARRAPDHRLTSHLHIHMRRLLLLPTLAAMPLFSRAIEEPDYEIIKKIDRVELRQYAPWVVAEVVLASSAEDAGHGARADRPARATAGGARGRVGSHPLLGHLLAGQLPRAPEGVGGVLGSGGRGHPGRARAGPLQRAVHAVVLAAQRDPVGIALMQPPGTSDAGVFFDMELGA